MSDESAKIMVIDDDVDIVHVVKEILSGLGHDVVEITRTRKPSLICERVVDENPQLILLDLMMPDVDGWQILELLQGDPVASQVPVVVFTAVAQALPDIKEYYGPAISDFITKPFEVLDLVETVERVLAQVKA